MLKKSLILLTSLSLAISPISVFADEKDDRIAELEAQVADLQQQLEEALSKIPQSTNQEEYRIGETWIVENQWKLTIDSVEETADRNEFSDKTPAAVYLVTFTYENLGYEDEYGDGLFMYIDEGIVDSGGMMGYSYPGDTTYYSQEVPVGAMCKAQACIGVDNAGSFTINFSDYDDEFNEHKTKFIIDVE